MKLVLVFLFLLPPLVAAVGVNSSDASAIIVGSVALGTALALVTNNGNGTWSFTYTVTDAQATHIADAFTTQYLREYQAAQRHGNITKAGFVDAKVKGYIQGVVSAYDKAEQLKTLPPITPIPLD